MKNGSRELMLLKKEFEVILAYLDLIFVFVRLEQARLLIKNFITQVLPKYANYACQSSASHCGSISGLHWA